MEKITDAFMKEMLAKSKEYFIVILKSGPNENTTGRPEIVWEHGRKNFELRQQGLLSIVCPVSGNPVIKGVAIFNTTKTEVMRLMDEDPAVAKGIFTYEILDSRSFPGDCLP